MNSDRHRGLITHLRIRQLEKVGGRNGRASCSVASISILAIRAIIHTIFSERNGSRVSIDEPRPCPSQRSVPISVVCPHNQAFHLGPTQFETVVEVLFDCQ